MGKKLVMHVITGLSTGGAESMLMKLMEQSSSSNFEHMVVALTKSGDIGKKIESFGVRVEVLNISGFITGIQGLFLLARLMLVTKPFVVQTWMYHADLIGGLVGKLVGVNNIIWNIRNSNLSEGETKRTTISVMKLSAALSAKVPDKIISCSYVARDLHVSLGYDAHKMVVIPNGFDGDIYKSDSHLRDEIRAEINVGSADFIISNISRFDPQKDHKNFIEAAASLNKKRPDIYYLLCGENVTWENDFLTSLIDQYGMRDRFRLLGKRGDVPALMAASDVVALSSSYGEAFPNVIGEAMLCEVPCVATDVGDSARIIGDTGFIVQPKNPIALADAWYQFAEMSNSRLVELGRLGRQSIVDNYDIRNIASRYDELYLTLPREQSECDGVEIVGDNASKDVSVVVIIKNDHDLLQETLESLSQQKHYISDLVIVDSGNIRPDKEVISRYESDLNVKYYKIDKSYPGRARNFGISKAAGRWVAFLDAKTIPKPDWLVNYRPLLKDDGVDFVYARGYAVADSEFQEYVMQASYGKSSMSMLPGSIVGKGLFSLTDGFIEDVRSSEDIEWINSLRYFDARIIKPSCPCVLYYGLPSDIVNGVKKYYIYGMNTARTATFILQKTIYVGVVAVGLGLLFANWNNMFAEWDMSHEMFIPHITKIYLLFVISLIVIFRGVVRPLTSGYKIRDIFPFRWIVIGVVGLVFDLSKFPGYTLGAIIHFKRMILGESREKLASQ